MSTSIKKDLTENEDINLNNFINWQSLKLNFIDPSKGAEALVSTLTKENLATMMCGYLFILSCVKFDPDQYIQPHSVTFCYSRSRHTH
ncbi:hypothetical protein ACTXT7_000043 [Hymenolepis weldensis]